MANRDDILMISTTLIDDLLTYVAGGKTPEEAATHFNVPVRVVEDVVRWNLQARKEGGA